MARQLSALEFEFVKVSYIITPPGGFGPETKFTEFVCSGTDCMFECKYIYNMSCVLAHQQSNRSMFFSVFAVSHSSFLFFYLSAFVMVQNVNRSV